MNVLLRKSRTNVISEARAVPRCREFDLHFRFPYRLGISSCAKSAFPTASAPLVSPADFYINPICFSSHCRPLSVAASHDDARSAMVRAGSTPPAVVTRGAFFVTSKVTERS
jgi:hypothetical protein